MYINADQIKKIDTELADVAYAIVMGDTVWELCPVDGWVKTTQINMHLSRADYHLGETAPE